MASEDTPILTPETARRMVVASNEGNDLADSQFVHDMRVAPAGVLVEKYGQEVADSRRHYIGERAEVARIQRAGRDAHQILGDTAVSAASGFVGISGNMAASIAALGGAVDQYFNKENTGLSELGVGIAQTTQKLTQGINSLQSPQLQARKAVSQIDASLDAEDSETRYQKAIEDGENAFLAGLAKVGRDTIDSGERLLSDGALLGDATAQALGSLGPSARLAQGGVNLANQALGQATSRVMVSESVRKAAERTATALGSAAGIAQAEASGTYADAVNAVMARTPEQMASSQRYNELLAEGMDPLEAQQLVAADTGFIAYAKQLPRAAGLGLIAARFNANPTAAFRGKSMTDGLKEVGKQALEEGLQGSSSQLATNEAIREVVDPNQSLTDGVGEQFATGALAGAGMAGVIGSPSMALGTTKDAAALIHMAATSDRTKAAMAAGLSAGADGLDTVSRVSAPLVDRAKPVVQKGVETAQKAAAPLTDKISFYANRSDQKLQLEGVAKAEGLVEVISQIDSDLPAPVTQVFRVEDAAPVPESFKAKIGETSPSLMHSVGGILKSFTETTSIEKLSDGDALYAAERFDALRKASSDESMPAGVRNQITGILSSPDVKKVEARVKEIDLNKTQDVTVEPTPETVTDSVRVAKVNPANVNPAVVEKILAREENNLSDEEVRLLGSAAKIAAAVNTHAGAKVEILTDERVALSQKPAYKANPKKLPDVPDMSKESRSISVDGFTDSRGTKLRSVNDFAADIFKGAQAADKSLIDESGYKIPVKAVADQMGMFVTHMVNKVEALNQSLSQNDAKGKGPSVMFESLVGGKKLLPAGAAGGAKPVFVHSSSPTSVKKAREIANDARVTVEVYNTLIETFPDLFPGKTKLELPALALAEQAQVPAETKVDTPSQTPAPEAKSETQATETKEETQAPEEAAAPETVEETAAETPVTEKVTPKRVVKAKIKPNQKSFDEAPVETLIESVNQYESDVQSSSMAEERKAPIRAKIEEFIGRFNLPKDLVRDITWMESRSKSHLGQAYWAERIISLKPGVVRDIIESTDKNNGLHVVLHELMHLIDAKASKFFGKTASMNMAEFDPGTGKLFAEVKALTEQDPEMAEYFRYALGFKTPDELASELFAEIGALYLKNPAEARRLLPQGVAYVETVIEQAGGTVPVADTATTGESEGDAASDVEVSDEVSVEETPAPEGEKTYTHLNERFSNTYEARDTEAKVRNAEQLLALVREQDAPPTEYLNFVTGLLPKLVAKANERLTKKLFSGKPISELAKEENGLDEVLKMQNLKNAMIVDPATGQYDPELLGLAAAVVVDWLTGVRGMNPSQLEDTMEDLGLTYEQLGRDGVHQLMTSVAPRQATEGLARQVLKVWNLKVNLDAPMVDSRGAVEGLVKELITALSQLDNAPIRMEKIHFNMEVGNKDAQTIVIEPMREIQEKIGVKGRNAIQKVLMPEEMEMPAIGETISHVDKTQTRGDVELTKLERKALKKMQDTAHYLSEGVEGFVSALGFDALNQILGFKDPGDLADRHPLRASIEGKNLSIRRDFEDAMSVVNEVKSATQDYQDAQFILGNESDIGPVPVRYRVGISKVGRHQFKGINPQNNKILRALITPTHAKLDMTKKADRDAFWLTVAQAADLNKVENENHTKILSEVQAKFQAKYGEAAALMETYLETGNLDQAAFVKAVGQIEMAQITAILAVAQYRQAVKNGTQSDFTTTMSFELDGKTDGPGNMMANFGQGILTRQDYSNFQKVGYFLGSLSQTLNKFFNGAKNDLYVSTAQEADRRLFAMIRDAKDDATKAKLKAAQRFASIFGDLEVVDGEIVMTRNSAKNPMTKTVYGSGVRGVGAGVAEAMVLAYYQALQDTPVGKSMEDVLNYPELDADIKLLFGYQMPDALDKSTFMFPAKATKVFEDFVSKSIGEVLSSSAKAVIGDEITKVNDTLVFATTVQSEFMTRLFRKKLTEMAEKRVAEGKMGVNKQGTPVLRSMSQRDYNTVVEEVRAFAATYFNGDQRLEVSSFSMVPSDSIELSANMDGKLQMKSSLMGVEEVGVRVIPYVTIGRGDAMMMNTIYGSDNAPEGTLNVFDGIDMAVDKVKEYANRINEAVAKNWDRDVIGDIATNLDGFLALAQAEPDILDQSFKAAKALDKQEKLFEVQTPTDLLNRVREQQRQNLARKKVFRKIGISVDHMGGSDTAFVRGDREYSFDEINDMITEELNQQVSETTRGANPVKTTEVTETKTETQETSEVVDEVTTTDVAMVLHTLARETRKKHVRDTVKMLSRMTINNYKAVMGSTDAVLKWYQENIGERPALRNFKGFFDPANKVIGFIDPNHETMAHELIHMFTFEKVLAHYEGQTDQAVERLEALMAEFMEMDFSRSVVKAHKKVSEAANNAKTQILKHQTQQDAFSKAAALNEFMAWTLSNEALMKELKARDTSLVQRLTRQVKAWMQRLLGGVPTDMYSNILFNTQILGQVPPSDIGGGDSGNGGNGDGGNGGGDGNNGNGEVTPPAEQFTNFWIELIKQRIEEARTGTDKQARGDQLLRYTQAADKSVAELLNGGFNLDEYQQRTFKAIHMVLAMEMRLNTASAQKLNRLYERVTDGLTPEMFGPKDAQRRYSTVMDLFGRTKNDEGVSDAIAVLLALSQTSKGFRSALDQLPEPDSAQPNGGSLNDILSSATGMLMRKAIGTVEENGNAREALDRLSQSILREDGEREFAVLRGLLSNIDRADAFFNGAMNLLAERTGKAADAIEASQRSALTKTVVGSVAQVTNFLSSSRSDIALEGLKRMTHMGTSLDNFVPIREFVSEMVGTDMTNAEIMQLLDRTTYAVQAVRQEYRETVPVLLQDEFTNHPDAEQWRATHHVMGKTDLSALFSLSNPDRTFRLLEDDSFLDQRIKQVEKTIRKNFPDAIATVILSKSNQLANYMTGGGAGHMLMKNAYAINKLVGGDRAYNSSMTKEIDTLVSLYAVQKASVEEKAMVSEMYRQDPQAMQNLMVYMQGLNQEEDLKTISEAARLNGYKGYIPDQAEKNAKLVIEDDANRQYMEERGYIRVGDAHADEGFSSEDRGYYFTRTKQEGAYSQGVMQSVQDSYRGVNATTGLTINGTTSGVIAGEAVSVIVDEMNDLNGFISDDKEALTPVYDEDGVAYFERAMNPDLMQLYLQPESNLATMLGVWAGRQVEEKFAREYNAQLVKKLKEIWDNREVGSDKMFENMADSKDPVFQESWRVISPQTKELIENTFGEGYGFMVRKDMVNLALGYRDPSIVDVWSGKTRMPKVLQDVVKAAAKGLVGNDGMRALAAIENGTQTVVSEAKDLIVVRSLVVPYMNTQANVFQLSNRGVGHKQMYRSYPEKLAEIEQLNINQKKLIELDMRIRLAAGDSNRVSILQSQKQVILDENARMSIAPLVREGAYKNISEGITDLDVEITSGRLNEWIEGQISKLPGKLQTITKYGFVSKDTALYKGANKAVQYGDFIARAIYYDHLTKEKGLTHEAAMVKVGKEFVNFSVLPGRTRTALEGVGATWFLSFKIRIMKIAMEMLRENPARSLIVGATVGELGSPVADNLASVAADGSLDYALGWEMLLGSAELNPWVNLIDFAADSLD